jgi:hypothetical protein
MLSISLSGSAAFSITADASTGTALGSGKSCTVAVQYSPASAGQSDAATLTASGKWPATPAASGSLTGASTAGTPDLTLSPGTRVGTGTTPKNYFFDLGSVASTTQTFRVTNDGTGLSADAAARDRMPGLQLIAASEDHPVSRAGILGASPSTGQTSGPEHSSHRGSYSPTRHVDPAFGVGETASSDRT